MLVKGKTHTEGTVYTLVYIPIYLFYSRIYAKLYTNYYIFIMYNICIYRTSLHQIS